MACIKKYYANNPTKKTQRFKRDTQKGIPRWSINTEDKGPNH